LKSEDGWLKQYLYKLDATSVITQPKESIEEQNFGCIPFWMMEVVMTTGAIRRAKLQSKIITTNKPTPNFLQARCPSGCPTSSVRALKGKYHIPRT